MDTLKKLSALELEAKAFGFCWENSQQIMEQIMSECHEIQVHLHDKDQSKLQDEIGDLILATFSLCVFHHLDPTATLAKSVDKFARRFALVKQLTQQQGLENLTNQPFSTLMSIWNQAKTLDRESTSP